MAFIFILFVLLVISWLSFLKMSSNKIHRIKLAICFLIVGAIALTIGTHYKEVYLYDHYESVCTKLYICDESKLSADEKSKLIDECREINDYVAKSAQHNSIWSFYPKQSKDLIPLDYSKLL